MSAGTPPSLQQLAGKSLLSHHALTTSALDNLPLLLIPSLFVEAYTGGHREVLKAMVQAWPFPCLPLGDLAQPPDQETFKAVLGGLDLLLARRERPRQWKLQLLDLQGEHPGIWTLGYPAMAQISYPKVLPVKPRASPWTEMAEEQPLVIAIHLTIDDGTQDDLQAFLLHWARERKERVRLCSRDLQILCDSSSEIQKALSVVSLDSIQELLVSELWHGETMQTFAPYLSQMKNLRKLTFCNMRGDFYTPSSPDFSYSSQLGAQLGQLQGLQELHMQEVLFLGGKLPAILRSLPPLQLQHLRLRNLSMDSFSPDPLRALLEQVAGTLETLALEDCNISDAHVSAFLPTLSQCSKISFFSFYGNHIFMDTLQSLLRVIARLGHLSGGIYSPPLESYGSTGNIDPDSMTQVLASLAQALKDVGTTQKVQVCTDFCHYCNTFQYYSLEPDGSWVFTEEGPHGLAALPE
ncbi:PRAME family member 12-like [Perognathus longimembris pacificus]|uniref:PRAME family member 12-like n=1 Tax=Perognathus longimembris pacificus TaxID=214514 RepID=UPI002018EF94|nr:PRAME family member 12-like [Perognathus longimembris pacificus]